MSADHRELMEDIGRLALEGRDGRLTAWELDFVADNTELLDVTRTSGVVFQFSESQHETAVDIFERMMV